VLAVEGKIIFSVFYPYCYKKLCLKVIASEASEEKNRNITVLGIQKS